MKIDEIVQEWYAEFVSIEGTLLFQLMTAANYMAIEPLLDLTCLALSVLTQVSIIILFVLGINVGQSFGFFILHAFLNKLTISLLGILQKKSTRYSRHVEH